jgi:hypothetical protein
VFCEGPQPFWLKTAAAGLSDLFRDQFSAIPEPAWHRRARQLRQGARLNVHNLVKAFDVLGNHHGSAMPKQFWSSAWQVGPPSWLQQPRQPKKYSTWDQNTTQQYTQKPVRAYVICSDAACRGWAYTDKNEISCQKCGSALGGKRAYGGGANKQTGAAPVDSAAFDALGEGDPLRKTLQHLIDSGKATLDKKVPTDAFAELQGKVRQCTQDLFKSQNQLNHQRNQLRQAREKVTKLEEAVVACEQDTKGKMLESNVCNTAFEKMVADQNLRSQWAPPVVAGGICDPAQVRVVQLEGELQHMRDAMQHLTAQLQLLQQGGAPAPGVQQPVGAGAQALPTGAAQTAAGAAALAAFMQQHFAAGAPAAGASAPATGAPAGTALALENGPRQQGNKRARKEGEVEEDSGGADGSTPDDVSMRTPGQPQDVLAAAQKAASDAAAALAPHQG